MVEISNKESKSQTTAVTVYEVFAQNSPFSLTIIDTHDKNAHIDDYLKQLFTSKHEIYKIHAVCLVLKATDVRLHDRQRFILNKIMSQFENDIGKYILPLFTQGSIKAPPTQIINFIKDSGIQCAENKNGEPVYFQYNISQSDCCYGEDRESYKPSWDFGMENFKEFFGYKWDAIK